MKKKFSKEYVLINKGCYSEKQVSDLKFTTKENITIKSLFNQLPVKDFSWFLVRKCELNNKQKRLFAIHCAEQVLPIFEKHYPKDKRVRECIEATKLFVNDEISLDELREKQATAAYAYAADATATAAATVAAYAATAAAATAAYAYAADAAATVATVAYAATAYRESIWNFVNSIK